jgi:hypothetical protein
LRFALVQFAGSDEEVAYLFERAQQAQARQELERAASLGLLAFCWLALP